MFGLFTKVLFIVLCALLTVCFQSAGCFESTLAKQSKITGK